MENVGKGKQKWLEENILAKYSKETLNQFFHL